MHEYTEGLLPGLEDDLLKEFVDNGMVAVDVLHEKALSIVHGHIAVFVGWAHQLVHEVQVQTRHTDAPGDVDLVVICDAVVTCQHCSEREVRSGSISLLAKMAFLWPKMLRICRTIKVRQ